MIANPINLELIPYSEVLVGTGPAAAEALPDDLGLHRLSMLNELPSDAEIMNGEIGEIDPNGHSPKRGEKTDLREEAAT